VFARLIFSILDFGARKGLSAPLAAGTPSDAAKLRARQTGVPGETYGLLVSVPSRLHSDRMARQFLRARHIESAEFRFDILAIATRPGAKPLVRLDKGAFNAERN
jgi:hypothetical protein